MADKRALAAAIVQIPGGDHYTDAHVARWYENHIGKPRRRQGLPTSSIDEGAPKRGRPKKQKGIEEPDPEKTADKICMCYCATLIASGS